MYLTEGPGHGEKLAREVVGKGYRTIVAAGGDGTVNEVLNGIDPKICTLGVLPVGTMNVLALELGIPPNLEKALEVIRAGKGSAWIWGWQIEDVLFSWLELGWMRRQSGGLIPTRKKRGVHGAIF